MSLTATAPAARARRATSAEKVSAEIGTSTAAARPSIAGTSFAASSSGGDRRPAAGGDGADVEHPESRLGELDSVTHGLIGRAAARALEERVVGDVDDPGADRALEGELAVAQ